MPPRTLTVDDLWSLPRVGGPVPDPRGRFAIVPVTTYDMEANRGTTRLWWVPAKGGDARPITSPHVSSDSPAVSPGGRRLVFLRKDDRPAADARGAPKHADKPQLYLMSLEGGEAERLTDMPLGVSQPRWLPDGKRVAFLAPLLRESLTPEGTAAVLEERAGRPQRPNITEDRFYRYWDQWLTDAPATHVFVMDLASRRCLDLTPDLTRLFDPESSSPDYDVSPDGSEISFTALRSDPPHDPLVWGVYRIPVPPVVEATLAPVAPSLLDPDHPGHAFTAKYSPDGRTIVYGVQYELDFYADRVRLVAFDREAGTHNVLTEAWDRSANEWVFSEDGATVFVVAEEAARSPVFALAPGATEPERITPLEGSHASIQVAGGRLFATWHSLSHPPEVYCMRLDGSGRRQLTDLCSAGLEGIATGSVEDATFPGHGGEPVQMFVVHPPAGTAPHSLVHMIHGGPHSTFGDQWHWRWNAQVIAGAGHVVALVNFHGSTGWGQDFAASILGRWGDQPHADVMAATDALIARGLVDPGRMAITGGSYGGYLVTWIASQTDRFACAVNHAGVSDFQTQYASDVTQGRRRALGGALWDDLAGLDRYSPLRQARGFRTPMLVIHGERDFRVPHAQGLQVYNVCKAMGVPARLVSFPDENHWVQKPQNSRIWYSEFLAWLARWLDRPPGGARA